MVAVALLAAILTAIAPAQAVRVTAGDSISRTNRTASTTAPPSAPTAGCGSPTAAARSCCATGGNDFSQLPPSTGPSNSSSAATALSTRRSNPSAAACSACRCAGRRRSLRSPTSRMAACRSGPTVTSGIRRRNTSAASRRPGRSRSTPCGPRIRAGGSSCRTRTAASHKTARAGCLVRRARTRRAVVRRQPRPGDGAHEALCRRFVRAGRRIRTGAGRRDLVAVRQRRARARGASGGR